MRGVRSGIKPRDYLDRGLMQGSDRKQTTAQAVTRVRESYFKTCMLLSSAEIFLKSLDQIVYTKTRLVL